MSTERKTETVPQWKQAEVDELVEYLQAYDSVGIVNIAGIPSRQLQDMRRELHGNAELRVSRNTLLERALGHLDEGVEELTPYISGQVGLIATDENPFGLYKQLEASKTPAPIGAGEVAPDDITIPEGDTGVDPGPFVGELQSVGANARIQGGSIQVVEDSHVLDAGEEVSAELANVLSELGIEPKEVGLDLRAVFADGVLFEPEELGLDIDAYRDDVSAAAARARNLSVNAVYPTTQTAPALLSKALGEAKSVALQGAIESPDTMGDLIGKADGQVRALAAQIDDEEALPEELRDIDAPASTTADEESSDEADEKTETETDADDAADEDDDDDDDAGAALDDMFG